MTSTTASLTPQQQQIVHLVVVVPNDQWVSFGDIADAMKELGFGCTARNVSNALDRYTERYRNNDIPEDRWRIINIWGKVRNSEGRVVWAGQGTSNPRGARVVSDVSNPSNVAWAEVGGRLNSDGTAKGSYRYPLASMIRTGRLDPQVAGGQR